MAEESGPGTSTAAGVEEIVHVTSDPEGEPPAFAHSLADALPYGILTWPNLEKLLRLVATRELGWDQVRIYGTPGQTQFGIDIIGIQPDGTYGAIQSKHYESFNEKDLRKAVTKFDPGNLPIKGITRLIVATAVATDRRQIVDALDELRPSRSVIFEFWDASNLDTALSRHADIVAKFFGLEAARQFCGYAPTLVEPPDPDRAQVASDVTRGPENLPEVVAALARAQRTDADPAEAATAYADAQQVLRDANFAAHARVLDAERIDSLIAANRQREAVVALTEAFWDALNVAELDEADAHARRIQDLRQSVSEDTLAAGGASNDSPARPSQEVKRDFSRPEDVEGNDREGHGAASDKDTEHGHVNRLAEPAAPAGNVIFVQRLANAVLVAHAVARTPAGNIDSIVETLDLPDLLVGFEDDHSMVETVGRLAVLVAQTSLNDPLDSWAQSRVDQLRAVHAILTAAELENTELVPLTVALAIEIADATHDWAALRLQARRRTLKRQDCATVEARYALANALRGRFDDADLAWLDAIEEACLDGHYSDAAEWVYARRNALLAMHPWPRLDPNTHHRTAHALQHLGDGPRQPTIRRTAERAVNRALEGKARAAALVARDYARRAYAAGSWRQYSHASTLLARTYTESSHHLEAVARLVVAGETDKAVKAAGAAGDTWLDVSALMTSISPRTRSVAFRVVATQGDLLPDERLPEVEDVALEAVRAVLGPDPKEFGVDNTYLAALRVLASISDRLSAQTAAEVLELLEPSVEREPGHYRHSDEWHVRTVAGIAAQHPEIRGRALIQLIELGVSDSGAATYVTRHAHGVLTDHINLVDPVLRPMVELGNPQAARLRARVAPEESDTFTGEAVEEARLRLLEPPITTPGLHFYGSGHTEDVLMVKNLPAGQRRGVVDALVEHAHTDPPPVWDIKHYLEAATGLATGLGPQPELFVHVLELATKTPSVTTTPAPTNPLAMFQVTGYETDPRPAATLLAAQLASDDSEQQQVQDASLNLLLWNGENAQTLAYAIWESYGADIVTILPMLAAQPEKIYRSLAAEAWVHHGAEDPYVGARLAHDREPTVRRMLARHLSKARNDAPLSELGERVLQILTEDPRHSVRALINSAT